MLFNTDPHTESQMNPDSSKEGVTLANKKTHYTLTYRQAYGWTDAW